MLLKKIITSFLLSFFLFTLSKAQNVNVVLKAHVPYPGQTLGNICGYVDSTGREYALVGASTGLSIVDVSDPVAPIEVYKHTGPTGQKSHWQEIKVSGNYAYVVTEAGGGVQIFNLSSLPDTSAIVMRSWTGDSTVIGLIGAIHALHIDGDYLYLYGCDLFGGAPIVADISDRWNPKYVGNYQNIESPYVHDGYVRNDTMYSGHIYKGFFAVVDFRDKANPITLATQNTPGAYTHNTWLSTNGKVIFTTDERDNSFLTAYDISDLQNISELDRIQSNPGSFSVVHNTHIIRVAGNDYAVTSWYRDGFTIVDVGRPQNMVQVGNYDTSVESGGGTKGAWGVFPYFPSGTIVVSNIDEGLFVFTPNFVRASYLEGNVIDSVCGVTLNNVYVNIVAANVLDSTNISGDYKTGTYLAGTYDVTFSRSGYFSKTIKNVVLTPGSVTSLNVQLQSFNTVSVTGLVIDKSTSLPISNASLMITDTINSYAFTTDTLGSFESCNVVAANDYNVFLGKWGYKTYCNNNQIISNDSSALTYQLTKGYSDDFTFNFLWTVTGNASSGQWQRAIPKGTYSDSVLANPNVDDDKDCYNVAYVTGNNGFALGDNDVDGGPTILTSPIFDLTNYVIPYVEYSRWFYNGNGNDIPNDSLKIYLDNGITKVLLESVTAFSFNNSSWQRKSFKISDYIVPTATMKLIVQTEDVEPGNIVEAGFDNFLIHEGPSVVEENKINSTTSLKVYPNPFTNQLNILYELKNKVQSNSVFVMTDVLGKIVYTNALTQGKGVINIDEELNSGIYFVKIVNGAETTETSKVIKLD